MSKVWDNTDDPKCPIPFVDGCSRKFSTKRQQYYYVDAVDGTFKEWYHGTVVAPNPTSTNPIRSTHSSRQAGSNQNDGSYLMEKLFAAFIEFKSQCEISNRALDVRCDKSEQIFFNFQKQMGDFSAALDEQKKLIERNSKMIESIGKIVSKKE